MMSIADLVRMPRGTVQTYILNPGEESSFLKRLSVYAGRVNAKVEHDIWICVRNRDDKVQRMVVCKVLKAGKKLKRKRKNDSAKSR